MSEHEERGQGSELGRLLAEAEAAPKPAVRPATPNGSDLGAQLRELRAAGAPFGYGLEHLRDGLCPACEDLGAVYVDRIASAQYRIFTALGPMTPAQERAVYVTLRWLATRVAGAVRLSLLAEERQRDGHAGPLAEIDPGPAGAGSAHDAA